MGKILLINHTHVHSSAHVTQINGDDLPWLDIIDADGKYATQMKLIPPGWLFKGNNTIQVVQNGNDNFIVFDVVVHWREQE